MTIQHSKAATENQSDEIDIGKLFGILLDAKWLIIATTFIFAVVGVVFALLSTPIYKADALIQIEQKNSGGISSLVGDMGELFASESSATTEIEIIKSRMILGDTVDKFNLTTVVEPQYFPVVGKGLARLRGERNLLSISRFTVPQLFLEQPYTIVVVNAEAKTYQLVSDDRVILEGKAGELAEKNGYELFVTDVNSTDGFEFAIAKRSELDAIEWIKQNLSVSERGKQTGILELSFTGENREQISSLLNDISQNYFLQNVERNSAEAEKSLQFLKSHLPDVKTNLTASEDTLNRFRQQNDSIDLGLEAQSTLKVMVELEAQLNELTFKESEISQRFTKDHPAYIALLDKRATLLKEKERLNKQIQKMPKTQREVLRMTRDVEVNQQIYVQLLNKVQELSIVKAGTVGNVRILDHAQSYAKPVKPKKPLIVVLATLLGGMISVAFVLVKAAFHRGVENPDDIEQIGLSVYASVPKSTLQMELHSKLKHIRKQNKDMILLAESNPADLSVEALRGLRTSLHFAMMEAKNNVLMISGPAPGIGKSFISTNFAAVAAKTGQKVLLIDADMRKGYLQQPFGLNWEIGLSDVLSGKVTIEQSLKQTQVENLDIVTRGQVPPNPSELLMHPRFKTLVEWASEHYDLVIIDTPPVLAVTDPSIVGALAGTTLMVARFGMNTVKEIDVARNRFEQSGIEVKGVILNATEKKASSYYGYGYYNYSYKSES
ncbi:polysaccharide biosynthesis tyrosine autokinase [Vibrio fluvialis]|uniref:polysaccharide biosynthesis tyrosine autokinase n=1 Tax=Vibrio fluvialis TaxID=676 RepID=UPI00192BAE69|nr:polysaccharide biosynthesis tyrosine autokinase [Vibrio fluvialis]MBL4288150.1 polysaccharide biosynthesis tyrosine autokinase [Vibrio fluvialis]MBL4292710.1 polysaccharide biosynthesis tyrosine autokinase [Vibrio fluvialis]MBY7897376.1 polysaccharide biosynthesis tyrosine autokinase [Vibrio fluvialis]MBY8084760.1 polysaccharide biosynthesis tyrosine autokinase [Vibrio fluvialis]MBY8093627.1 polysaccharide biosynthesis tyrosine autokinase [Vibrio fluvialis]